MSSDLQAQNLPTEISVGVHNVAPTIDEFVSPSDPVAAGTAVPLTVRFTDPDLEDTHTTTIDWGDGTSDTIDGALSPLMAEHVSTQAGVYTATVSVTDGDGGTDTAESGYVVVYDPDAGFVTGGGWINSPAGADVDAPSATGRATFGFVSRYRRGATVPTGNTQFQFRTAGHDFPSTAYEIRIWTEIDGVETVVDENGVDQPIGGGSIVVHTSR